MEAKLERKNLLTLRRRHASRRARYTSAVVSVYLNRETKRRATWLYIIKTSPDKDAAIEQKLREIAAKGTQLSPALSLAFDNCSVRSNEGLDAGGIPDTFPGWPTPGNTTPRNIPGSAGDRAMHAPGFNGSRYIPKGAEWQPALWDNSCRSN